MSKQQLSFLDTCAGFWEYVAPTLPAGSAAPAEPAAAPGCDPEPEPEGVILTRRPEYETANDRGNEERVAAFLEQYWNCRALEQRKFSAFDRGLTRAPDDRIEKIVEIKCRNLWLRPDRMFFVGGKKFAGLYWYATMMKVPALLVIEFENAVACVDILHLLNNAPGCYFKMGGRRDRGDRGDWELCFFFPMSEFKILAKRGPE